MIIDINNKKISIDIEFETEDEVKAFQNYMSEHTDAKDYKIGEKLAGVILEKISNAF